MFNEATARLTPALHLTAVPDYLLWTLSLSEAYCDADSSTLYQLACVMLKDWHPALRRIVEEADIPARIPITVHSARLVQPWHTTNVTLLGDAIHIMSPGRGEGAHTALRDAELLRHTLVDVATKGMPLVEAKAQYETAMLRCGFEAVAASLNTPFGPRQAGQSARQPH